jgi:peptidoglycan/xylan/chitin deacetylase (PgdA/CDA1 family)
MFAPLFSALSPAGPGGKLSVLIFHRVLAAPDAMFPGAIDAAGFDRICQWLSRWTRVQPLGDAVAALRERRSCGRATAITFDDGYADNHELAMPILQRHGLTASFFVATRFLDGGRMWNDSVIEAMRRAEVGSLDLRSLGLPGVETLEVSDADSRRIAAERLIQAVKYAEPAAREATVDAIAQRCRAPLPGNLMMRADQVRALRRAGMTIGAHTHSHPILARLTSDAAFDEIALGKQVLEDILGEPVRSFAYPNGKPDVDYRDEHVAQARQLGFEVAVNTSWGAARADVDPLQVPRFTPWDRSALRFGLRLAGNLRRRGEVAESDGRDAVAS